MKKRGYHDFSFKIFVSRYRKILLGNNSVYQKISSIEKVFCMKGDITILCRKFFCLTVPENFVGDPLCFKKILVSKIFMHMRGFIIVLSKIFCLTGPKNFVRGPFRVSQNFWYRKNSWVRGEGGITIFCQNFLSHSADKFRRGTF